MCQEYSSSLEAEMAFRENMVDMLCSSASSASKTSTVLTRKFVGHVGTGELRRLLARRRAGGKGSLKALPMAPKPVVQTFSCIVLVDRIMLIRSEAVRNVVEVQGRSEPWMLSCW